MPTEAVSLEWRLVRIGEAILCAAGVAAILAYPGRILYGALTQEVSAVVYPICERLLSSEATAEEPIRLMGANILAFDTLVQARLRFSGLRQIEDWGMHSDGIPVADTQEFIDSLPRGQVSREFLTPVLPDLPPLTLTTVQITGVPAEDDLCLVAENPERGNVELLAQGQTVYHASSDRRLMREWNLVELGPVWPIVILYVVFAVLVVAPVVLLVRWAYRRRRINSAV